MNKYIDHSPTTYGKSASDEALEEIGQALALGLAPIAPPSQRTPALRSRLLKRIAQSVENHRGLVTLRAGDGAWNDLKVGVRAKVLHDNGKTRSALVEFAPGTSMPTHRHQSHEECVVLRGSLDLEGLKVGQHDFHVAPAGSRHGRIQSHEGALIYLRGTSIGKGTQMAREMISAWLPGRGESPQTIFADSGWTEFSPGVQTKHLWGAKATESMLVRIAPGARLQPHVHPHEEECMMVAGEAFFGDILLQAGEYQLAPTGTQHGEICSDVGALFFVHGAAYASE